MSGWRVDVVHEPEHGIHVVPVDDLREHTCSCTCWCRPVDDHEEPDVWMHNSLDQRERYEKGELRPQ